MDSSATKFFSLEEIAENNGKTKPSVWIIIKNIVYDVTPYLNDHPGGSDLITDWAGKDGTKAFDEFGHSGEAKKDLKQYKIGEVRQEDRKKPGKAATKSADVKVQESSSEKPEMRSCLSIVTCGLCG